jgi:hypothetical protein
MRRVVLSGQRFGGDDDSNGQKEAINQGKILTSIVRWPLREP